MNALLLTLAFAISADPTPPAGVLPNGKDGKPLNLDFETGTLKDWTAEGEAFKDQPIQGDTVAARRTDSKSEHQGKYWIGGFEKFGDKPTGTLTSVPFAVTHNWGSFLVGGGPHKLETCVEIVDVAKKEVIFRASGEETENMARVAVDLTKYQGKEIQIRIVDKHTGHWGHINFDDFRFHTEKPKVVERVPLPDDYKYAGLPPKEAAKAMTVPKGFSVDVIAAEPDLHQPIAFTWDDRGRLWVVEAYTYPRRNPEKGPVIADKKLGDKIIIFEDTDGDGTFDKKTVFFEGLNLVSGIEYGFGGIWVGAAPYLLFIPIDAKTEKAGEPKILLDGWGYQDTHETLNSFIWGPDGWLYGCHGVFTHSNVGKPGAKDAERTKINAGVWRYHPTKHTFEVFAEGTSNPWGLDYNQNGDFFETACVIPHLYHMVQGGRYQRQAGQHFNPYTYDDIKTIAKHRHYVGNQWNDGDRLKSSDLGGGHAHSGLMIYQGGAWPKEYNGKLFMGNLHGHRINVDEVKPKGSSYEGDRNPDFLLTNDKWSMIVAIKSGPDGNVYFCDWYDKQICHRNEPEIWDRTNGRLYRAKYEGTKPVKAFDLQKCTDAELVKYQLDANDWYARHARRILQERSESRDQKAKAELVSAVELMATKHERAEVRLRGIWLLASLGSFDEKCFEILRDDTNAHVQGAAFYYSILHKYWPKPAPSFTGYGLALQTLGPIARRYVASAMMQMPADKRFAVLHVITKEQNYAEKSTQASDPLLPMLYWYAVEQTIEDSPDDMLWSMHSSRIPELFEFTARRVGSLGTPAAGTALVKKLEEYDKPHLQLALLRGLQESVKGKRQADAPKGWDAVSAKLLKSEDTAVRSTALALAVTYGDVAAFDTLRKILIDTKAELSARQSALASLLDARDKQLPAVLQSLIGEPTLRPQAVRALASFDDSKTPVALLAVYKNLTPTEKRDAIATLSSRAAFAKELLAALEAKAIPNADIPAEIIRQLRNLNDKALNEKIASVWGTVRDTPADRKKLIADWGRKLSPAALAPADLGAGRAIYARTCQQCHTLYGVGGKVGPEITGANRGDLGYLLENIFDPSAVIPKEYAATKFDLIDGRVVTGILKEENKATLTVVTATETLTIPVKDVDKRTPSELSMMPDDITKTLNDTQIRDLVAYLKHTQQVPILGDAENAKDFFNGKDFTGWDFDKDVWSVDNGEIVGKTKTGLKRNNFVKSTMDLKDFKLTVKTKLTPNAENSGIQFRSVPIEGGEMRGPQADMGKGWWGKLYEESGRGLLVKEGGEKFVKEDDWNEYVVEAIGPKVKLWINGNLICDYEDDKLAKRGVIAFQVHSGGAMEVRFKEIKLEVIVPKK